jgi:hypothetical protein
MTFATSAGSGEVAVRCLAFGSFAVAAGLRSIQHRTADLAQLDQPEGGHNGPPDVALVGLAGRAVKLGHCHVLPEQLGDRHSGFRRPPLGGLLQQFAQDNPGLLFGVHRPPVSQSAAGKWVGSCVAVNTEPAAWRLL